MLPYVVFCILDVMPRYFVRSLVHRPLSIRLSIVKILFHGGEYWFLYSLFIMLAVYPFVFRLFDAQRYKMFLFGILLLAITLTSGIMFTYHLFFFNTGVLLKDVPEVRGHKTKHNLAILSVSLIIWLAALSYKANQSIITALAGIASCYFMTYCGMFCKLFARFGEYSLQIYLLNGFTLAASRAITCSIFHVSSPLVIISFNMLADFFCVLSFHKVCVRKGQNTSHYDGNDISKTLPIVKEGIIRHRKKYLITNSKAISATPSNPKKNISPKNDNPCS